MASSHIHQRYVRGNVNVTSDVTPNVSFKLSHVGIGTGIPSTNHYITLDMDDSKRVYAVRNGENSGLFNINSISAGHYSIQISSVSGLTDVDAKYRVCLFIKSNVELE